ncbi:MAG TPA: helix-turn-helix transcriptional regulator [Candidatus Elarobacter sp.]
MSIHYPTDADFVATFYDAATRPWRRADPWPMRHPGFSVTLMSETFGERLRRLRNEQGYTVVDLAAAVGAAEGTIRHLENGDVKSPTFLLGLRLAEQLKVDPRYLALGEGIGVAARFDALERRIAKLEQRVAAFPTPRR